MDNDKEINLPSSLGHAAARAIMTSTQRHLVAGMVITGSYILLSLSSTPPQLPRAIRAVYGPYAPSPPPTPVPPLVTANPHGFLIAPPSVSMAVIQSELASVASPLLGAPFPRGLSAAAYIWRAGVALGIDPNVLMGFFWHESHYGTQGIATRTDSIGNLRPLPDQPELDGYCYYRSWANGVDAMYTLLQEYAANGAATIQLAIPVWAPPTDNNDDAAYIQDVLQHMAALTSLS